MAPIRCRAPCTFYVKNAHVSVPGIKEYIDEFTSDAAIGAAGYLTDRGLIPLHEEDHQAMRKAALSFTPLTM